MIAIRTLCIQSYGFMMEGNLTQGDHLRRLHKGSGMSLKPLQMSSYREKTKLKDKEERYSMQVVQLDV